MVDGVGTSNQYGTKKTGCIRNVVGLAHVHVRDPRGRGVFARVRKKWNVYIYVRGFCENARVSCSSLLGQGDMERRHEKITAIVTIQTGTHNGSHAHTSLEMASHETILLTPF